MLHVFCFQVIATFWEQASERCEEEGRQITIALGKVELCEGGRFETSYGVMGERNPEENKYQLSFREYITDHMLNRAVLQRTKSMYKECDVDIIKATVEQANLLKEVSNFLSIGEAR